MIRLTRTSLAGRRDDRSWWVRLNGQEIGRVRLTDGEWVGAVWRGCVHRTLINLAGSSRTRTGAVADVVQAAQLHE
jgi:hypothetical protein